MLSFRIALRYLLSRKSHGAVNVISWISVAAVAVAAAAMVIVLSVFNGFTRLAESKLSRLDPDVMLVPSQGAIIGSAGSLTDSLMSLPQVAVAAPEITEQGFAVADNRQMAVTVKGMTPRGFAASRLREITIDGVCDLSTDSSAMLSVGAAMGLNLRPSLGLRFFTIFEPRRTGRINPANPMGAFRRSAMVAEGVYQVEQEEYDRDMVIIPYETAAALLAYDDCATSVAVTLKPGASEKEAIDAISKMCVGRNLVVQNRYQQQQQAYRMISIEKWITFLMLAFILAIASLNIISTLSMLILEKQDNMAILSAMGATRRRINAIFVSQGWLIVIVGGIAGMAMGALLVLGQQHFGWIKLNATDPALMAIDVYPVVLKLGDLLITLVTILAVALVITPVIPLIRRRTAVSPND